MIYSYRNYFYNNREVIFKKSVYMMPVKGLFSGLRPRGPKKNSKIAKSVIMIIYQNGFSIIMRSQ